MQYLESNGLRHEILTKKQIAGMHQKHVMYQIELRAVNEFWPRIQNY